MFLQIYYGLRGYKYLRFIFPRFRLSKEYSWISKSIPGCECVVTTGALVMGTVWPGELFFTTEIAEEEMAIAVVEFGRFAITAGWFVRLFVTLLLLLFCWGGADWSVFYQTCSLGGSRENNDLYQRLESPFLEHRNLGK